MTTTLQNNVALLNARSGVYTAWQIRNFQDGDPPGPGVADYESFRVKQRVSGLAYSVDIGLAGALNQAWIRGTSRDGQGLYRCDNIDYTAPLVNTFLAQFNEAGFAAADPTNPRVDQVFLRVLDQQHDGGASNLLQTTVVTGTPSAPVTLDNRTGVGAVPANSILLADVLIPAAATTIPTVNIRDRRQFPLFGTVPPFAGGTGILADAVQFQPNPTIPVAIDFCMSQVNADAQASAVQMFLPRRIVGATRIRWKYGQAATAAATNYIIAIYDASGRKIVDTGAVAYTGAANSFQNRSETIAATTFEPGAYYVFIANAAGAAGAGAYAAGQNQGPVAGGVRIGPPYPGIAFFLGAGGAVAPQTVLGMGDSYNSSAVTRCVVPLIALSVG